MAVMNRSGVDGCPSRSRVRAGVRRSVPDRYWRTIVRRNSAGLSRCPLARSRSTSRTTSASMPRPALNVKYRSSARPSPMVRYRPSLRISLILVIPAAASAGSPSAWAKTLPPPPGMTASSGGSAWPGACSGVCPGDRVMIPLTASLTAPSPPCTMISSPRAAAASSQAWPR